MLIVRLFGGLGNQMFQYSFYQFLKKYGNEVYLDISDFQTHRHHYGFELDKVFDLSFDTAQKKDVRAIAVNQNNVIYRAFRKFSGLRITKESEFFETFNAAVITGGRYKTNRYFTGFWQNAHYVECVEETLGEEFAYKNVLVGKNADLVNSFHGKTAVSLHFRYGDYTKNALLGGICTYQYYKKAIKYVKDKCQDCIFIVFSDDIRFVKKSAELFNDVECCFVDWNNGENSYLDMMLMSLCDHNIIANSSFSWWGAWLNRNPDKIVIMPTQWNTVQTINQLQCKSWITM